ncbi:cardiolipin synthase ClsB [Rubrivivax gelatinosus]|uniref:Cardiolipin synthase B n=3 Tax=Rubrivivax gelatinosus TaxID=28068 RepID=I0HN53_RUBGI|nr:cardiolipin synthase ClsB [Rubrivivax gelatinosus]MBG6081048.1 cardiolipin synthase [Rubrivivax gelatinosus]BAL94440.1 putative cardiolipin synthetase [Rubrivivax gelatinosus IL144]
MPVPLDDPSAWAWSGVPRPHFVGGNDVRLLQGGDELFPRMVAAIEAARHEVWLATYIFHSDDAARAVAAALSAAAGRGVEVNVVVDGFGSLQTMATLREWLRPSGVRLEVFRPLDRWWAWLQPGQMRRLHTKLCVVDSESAYVGGINVIDDRHDLHHGWSDAPRLDYAVELRGPIARQVRDTARAMWARAHLGHFWGEELRALARSAAPVEQTVLLLRQLRTRPQPVPGDDGGEPVRAAFVVRDNLRQRRAIERSYVEAIRGARERVDIAVPYFYPGQTFRRALRRAAARGVRVRLLLQGKIDYRIAALAARALYDELRAHGVRIYEYTPAFLHAKVAVVDDDWATVGSSNIDPLSLLLNLEANVVVRDPLFARALADRLDSAIDASREVKTQPAGSGWRSWLHRGFVAWCASVYLRLAGIGGRY